MNIRPEQPEDYNAIDSLTYAAFENHPHHAPGAKPTEHLIIRKLRQNGSLILSLVVQEGDQLLGHISFSPITINGELSNWLALAPVSVAPAYQGKGIGSLLIKTGMELLRAKNVDGIVLIGEPTYYNRFGFQSHPNLTVAGVPAEYFMIQTLVADEHRIPFGTVGFDSAFSE